MQIRKLEYSGQNMSALELLRDATGRLREKVDTNDRKIKHLREQKEQKVKMLAKFKGVPPQPIEKYLVVNPPLRNAQEAITERPQTNDGTIDITCNAIQESNDEVESIKKSNRKMEMLLQEKNYQIEWYQQREKDLIQTVQDWKHRVIEQVQLHCARSSMEINTFSMDIVNTLDTSMFDCFAGYDN